MCTLNHDESDNIKNKTKAILSVKTKKRKLHLPQITTSREKYKNKQKN